MRRRWADSEKRKKGAQLKASKLVVKMLRKRKVINLFIFIFIDFRIYQKKKLTQNHIFFQSLNSQPSKLQEILASFPTRSIETFFFSFPKYFSSLDSVLRNFFVIPRMSLECSPLRTVKFKFWSRYSIEKDKRRQDGRKEWKNLCVHKKKLK